MVWSLFFFFCPLRTAPGLRRIVHGLHGGEGWHAYLMPFGVHRAAL